MKTIVLFSVSVDLFMQLVIPYGDTALIVKLDLDFYSGRWWNFENQAYLTTAVLMVQNKSKHQKIMGQIIDDRKKVAHYKLTAKIVFSTS